MTTGSTSETYEHEATNGTNFYSVRTKSWSGNDTPGYPPRRPEPMKKWIKPLIYKGQQIREGQWREYYPRYDGPKRTREKPAHPYSCSGSDYRMSHGYAYSPLYGTAFTYDQRTSTGFVSPWTANDDIALLQKAREAIAGSTVNFGVIAGESKKALEMVQNTAYTLGYALTRMRKGDFNGARRALRISPTVRERKAGRTTRPPEKELSERWLEMSYGWQPLLGDAHDAARFLGTQHSAPRSHRVIVTRNAGGAKNGLSYNQSMHITYIGSNYEHRMNLNVRSSKKMIIDVTETNVTQLSGLLDPYSVAWELTPWSFVADWFIPIGDYLQARQLPGSVSCTYVLSFRESARTVGHSLQKYTTGTDEQWSFTTIPRGFHSDFRFSRTIGNVLPQPPLPVIKTLSSVPSWQRAANSVALLIQRFGSAR